MTNLPKLIEFVDYLKKFKYSEDTVYNYQRDLISFDVFLSKKNVDFLAIDNQIIVNYKLYLASGSRSTAEGVDRSNNLSAQSINRSLSALKTYIKWVKPFFPELSGREIDITLLKNYKIQKECASIDSQIKLIEYPTKSEPNPVVALRNRAILEMMFAARIKISELINLKKEQFHRNGEISIESAKTNRNLQLSARAISCVREYLSLRGEDDLPYLFIPLRGKNAGNQDRKISQNYLQGKIKKYREELGLTDLISSREMGHSFNDYLNTARKNPLPIKKIHVHGLVLTDLPYQHVSRAATG
jgi:integrase/recombinase XerD